MSIGLADARRSTRDRLANVRDGISGIIAVAIGMTACTVDDIDLSGRSCPCLDGWTCDEASNRCIPSTIGSNAGAIDVASFKADWATPNAIRWSWELVGDEEDFSAFQLALGTSPEEVAARNNPITGAINPELDRFKLPRTGGDDPVKGTIVYDLVPDTPYFAQLIVIDTANRTSSSLNIAQKRTALPPIQEIVIMADAPPPTLGWAAPNCLALDGEKYAGSAAYGYVNHCLPTTPDPTATCETPATVAPLCWENLVLEGMKLPVTQSSFPSGAFDEAYVEFALRIDDSEHRHAWWSAMGLRAIGQDEFHFINPITFRADGAYRVYQLKFDAIGIRYEDIIRVGGLESFMVGSAWGNGATVHFDEVRIRW